MKLLTKFEFWVQNILVKINDVIKFFTRPVKRSNHYFHRTEVIPISSFSRFYSGELWLYKWYHSAKASLSICVTWKIPNYLGQMYRFLPHDDKLSWIVWSIEWAHTSQLKRLLNWYILDQRWKPYTHHGRRKF